MISNIRQTRSSFAWLIHIIKDSKWAIVLLTLLHSTMAVLTTLYPMITLKVLNSVEARDSQQFQMALLLFVVFMVFQLVIWYCLALYSEHVSFTIENRIKQFCVNTWLKRLNIYKSSLHTGELMNRLYSDIRTITVGCITIIPTLLSLLVRLVTTIVFLYFLLPQMATIMILGGIVMMIATTLMRKKIKELHKKVNEKDGYVRSYLQEVFQNPILIRSFGVEEEVMTQANHLIGEHRQIFRKRVKILTSSQLVISIAFNVAIVIGTTLASMKIMNQSMAVGTYVAVAQLISQMREPLVNLTGFIPRYFTMVASVERLLELNPDNLLLDDTQEATRTLGTPEAVTLSHIDFSYTDSSDDLTLANFSLTIPRGQHLGIVGESGGGKSTFLKVLIGIYAPHGGEIALEYDTHTVAVDSYNMAAYRQLFAYVPQSNALMSGTVREIVSFAARQEQKNDERLKQALEVACAWEFVESLPQGLDTPIKELGEGVSGGQMQRLAIARAIFSNRPFLVLDEATSALDVNTEKRLLHNLQTMTDKTIVLVTHRLEVLSICDKILDFNKVKEGNLNEDDDISV